MVVFHAADGCRDEAKMGAEYTESGWGLASFVGMIMGMVMVVEASIQDKVKCDYMREESFHWRLRMNEVVGDWEAVEDDSPLCNPLEAHLRI